MKIREAELRDLDELMKFYKKMCEFLGRKSFLPNGNKGGFPSRKMVEDAIQQHDQFIGEEDGRIIPQVCAHMAKNLKGDHTPAVIAAVYGNRHYDDALLQMKDILTEQGFVVIAVGAFLAEHSVFPSVASGRQDARDKAAMEDFAAKCCSLLKKKDIKEYGEIMLPGTPGYDGFSYEGVPFKPCGDEKCIGCGACAKICPQKAICAENPCQTDEERCIACGACIKACPTGARNYHSELYEQVRADFEKLCAEYRTPETFYAEEAVL